MTRRLLLLLLLILCSPAYGVAQPAVFLVRHAERADTASDVAPPMAAPMGGAPAADPDLSDAGRARARSLAVALKDANITAIYATEFKRTQQTASPIAQALGLTVIIVPGSSVATLVEKLKALPGNALVVGHSNTIPEVTKALGVKTAVQIPETDYSNLFVVMRAKKPVLLRLHYR
jgi:phosphohistidine phosphatase SixA